MELVVVCSHADDGLDFLLDQIFEDLVVVALVGPSDNPHDRTLLAFKRIPCGIDVGGLRVVDVEHILDAQDRLKPVLDGLECAEGFADGLVVDSGSLCGQGGGHRIVDVVLAAKGKLFQEYVAFLLAVLHDDPVMQIFFAVS